jgi:hypothetical protein
MPRGSGLGLIGALAAFAAAAGPPQAAFVGHYRLTDRVEYLGGLSGLEFAADGLSFTALSDSAALVFGRVQRDEGGAIAGVTLDGPPVRLTGADGALLDHPSDDAEGLAGGGGGFLISFELEPRVAAFDAAGALTSTLPVAPAFPGLIANAGLEALAIGPDGAIFAIPEGGGAGTASFPVFRFAHGTWTVAFHLAGERTFRPVGADIGPDGRLYLLERDFWPLIGFRTRLRRVALGGGAEEVLIETPAGRHGNLEGLSVWRDAAGRLRATMVSDNNFLPFAATEFADYTLPD